jgi:hypothetical protein
LQLIVGAFLASLVLYPVSANATCPTFHTLANGTTASATDVMDNFNNILGCPSFTGPVLTSSQASKFGAASGSMTAPTNSNTNVLLYNNSSTNWSGIGSHTDGSMYFVTGTSSPATRLVVAATGYVGIGTTNPGYPLSVVATGTHTVFATTTGGFGAFWGYNSTNNAQGLLGYGGWGVYCLSGSCGGSTTWTNNSDSRLKTRIRALSDSDGLAAIMRLRPVRFHWRDKDLDAQKGEQIGFIAQEAQKVFPEFIAKATSDVVVNLGDGKKETVREAKSMGYADLTAPLVKAVQELKAINDNQASQIAALKAQVQAQSAQLKTQNAKQQAENTEFRRRLVALEQKQLHLADRE